MMENHNIVTIKYILKGIAIFVGLSSGTLWIVFSTLPALYGDKEECVDLRIITLVGGIWLIASLLIKEIALWFIEDENGKKLVELKRLDRYSYQFGYFWQKMKIVGHQEHLFGYGLGLLLALQP